MAGSFAGGADEQSDRTNHPASPTNEVTADGADRITAEPDAQAIDEAFAAWWSSDDAQGQLSYGDRAAARAECRAAWRARR